MSRIRKGKKYPYIEKCRAVFVTSNSILVSATKEYLKKFSYDFGFPIAITGEDLCVMAWLKDFEQSNSLPQMRLLENVLAAITPSKELMDAYFSHLDDLVHQGTISEDEAALLRVDIFAKHELMDLTFGERENLNSSVIEKIRRRIREESILQGRTDAQKQHDAEDRLQRNNVCKRAEHEVEKEFMIKEKRGIWGIKFVSIIVAIAFIIASCYSFIQQSVGSVKLAILLVTVITTIEGVLPFLAKDNFLIRRYKHHLQRKKLQVLDERKELYLSLLEK